ncbi:paramyosin-like [Hemibagrus wyckioides]|uniref:paramyosin-like n=1 Tax=Hemibagrus wyckioides TaxID=337641 RepID=UPI00266C9016|nr:paramyosin-like [Hemibagrus wyckioides]
MLHLISLAGAGIYYLIKKRRDGEKTAELTDTPGPEDPVQTGSLLDPGLKCGDETQTDSAVPQGSVSEAEEKSQKREVSGSLLDSERSILEERVRVLEEVLCEAERESERKHKECERDKEHHSVLKCDQMTSTRLLELVQAEAEGKLEYTAQLENEISDLKSQVNTLQDTVQERSRLLSETRRKCEKAEEKRKAAEDILELMETRIKKNKRFLIWKRKSIQESLDELQKTYYEERMTVMNLKAFKSRWRTRIQAVQQEVGELSDRLSEIQGTLEQTTQELEQKTRQLAQRDSDWKRLEETVMKDHEVEYLAHRDLKVQYSEMKQQHDKLEEDNQRLREAYSTLEAQYEELKQRHGSQMVNRQQSSVQQAEEKLTAIQRKCDEIKRERKREREDYNLLKARYQQMEETLQECQELLKVHCTDPGSKGTTDP